VQVVPLNVKCYSCFIVKSTVYSTYKYSSNFKNRDCFITLRDRKGVFLISALLSADLMEPSVDKQRKKCALILRVSQTRPFVHYDLDVGINLTRHITNVTFGEQIVACHPFIIEKKCFVLSNANNMQYANVLPVFE
jgi:hypothetical protein